MYMYSLILNSNNRADKTNTNENDCEYYFDWSVLQQGKYKLTYSISKILTAPPTAFQNLIATKIPWGLYKASSYNSALQIIPDESGNGRNAVCSGISIVTSPIGNRNSVPLQVVSGVSTSTIVWELGSIPSQYTICNLTRYSSGINQGRILAGNGNFNYNFGFYRGSQPTIYDGNVEGCNNNSGLITGSTKWMNACVIRGNSVISPNHIMINGIPSGTNYLMNTETAQLSINNYTSDKGDFEMGCVIVWNQYLTASELVIVSNAIENLITTGFLK